MEIVSGEVENKLRTANEYCLKQAEMSIGFGEFDNAVFHLSRATQYQYFLNALENPHKTNKTLVENTVQDVLKESRFWQKNLGKILVHSLNSDSAEKNINGILSGKDKLFWQAYFYAEHWQNSSALKLFSQLVQQDKSVINLHWYGNLLSKQGRFSEAREPLEIVAKLEPNRYNHQSHLGNVYRALGMKEQAKKAYQKAAGLIFNRKKLGRVEYIHLVRCYNGLASIGIEDYAGLEFETTKLAIDSGSVTSLELERIKF